jgi:hypothetical protein
VIPTDLVAWCLGVRKLPSADLEGVLRVALSFREDPEGRMAFYVQDGTELHRYLLPFGSLSPSRLDDILRAGRDDAGTPDYRPLPDGIVMQSQPGAVYAGIEGFRTERIPVYAVTIPESLKMKDPESSADQRQVAGVLLGSERYSYETSLNSDGTLVIANLNNIYSINADGYLEYENAANAAAAARGSERDAFASAMRFVYEEGRRGLLSNLALYVSSVTETKDNYVFRLGYRIDEGRMLPVYVSYLMQIGIVRTEVDDAIEITASGSGVTSARWLIRRADRAGSSAEVEYHLNSFDINNIIDRNYSDLFVNPESVHEGIDEIKTRMTVIEQIDLAYMLTTAARDGELKPQWVLVANLTRSRYLFDLEGN